MSVTPKETERVSDIMTSDVLILSPDMQVLQAMRQLLDRDYSGAPVLSDTGELLGVLSRKDCLEAALNAHYHHTWVGPVSDYMTTKIQIMEPELDLISAANQFLYDRYRLYPVMDNGKLVGQISRSDIMHALSKHWAQPE